MKLKNFLCLPVLVFLVSFASANLACGSVIDGENFSSSWMNVQVYYGEKPLDKVNCTINPENKFCCNLDEIKSLKFAPGKQVFAFIYEPSIGYTSQKVSLMTTPESYTLFPDLFLQEIISIANSSSNILINKSEFFLSGSLATTFSNLNISVTNSLGNTLQEICKNCTNFSFSIPLEKGENNLSLISYGEQVFIKNFTIYSLDNLSINHKIYCSTCKGLRVAPGTEFIVSVRINSSHPINSEVLEYFPHKFESIGEINSSIFSPTHDVASFIMTGTIAEFNYTLKSPDLFFGKRFIFQTKVGDYTKTDYIKVLRNLNPFYTTDKFIEREIVSSLTYLVSPSKPLVINLNNSNLKLVALFPKKEMQAFFLLTEKKFSKNNLSYDIYTNIPNEEIDKIFVRLESSVSKNLSLYTSFNENLSYEVMDRKKIYEGYINSTKFNILIA